MYISSRWRTPRVVLYLTIFEFPIVVAMLALTGIADPNLYRTDLWQFGGDQGWNSSPSTIVYAFANYRPVNVPMVWSQFITSFNLVVGVLAVFILLVKSVMFVLHVWYPILSIITHIALVAIYAVSVYGQTGPDTIERDPSLHSAHPWYLTKGCSVTPAEGSLRGYCQQAQGTLAVTVLLLALYAVHLPLSIWSVIPTREQKAAHALKTNRKLVEKANSPTDTELAYRQQQWELQNRWPGTAKSGMTFASQRELNPTSGEYIYPSGFSPVNTGGFYGQVSPQPYAPPYAPVTPRTQAFHTLGGTAPAPSIDAQVAMKQPVKDLPLRALAERDGLV